MAGRERARALKADEREAARWIFQDSLDLAPIRLTRDSVLAIGAARTVGNTIHLLSKWGHFTGETLDLSDEGRRTLVHELVHVWQYQRGGLAYVPDSLSAQFVATLRHGTRGAAYDWRAARAAGLAWSAWNAEQQAKAIEELHLARGRVLAASARGQPSPAEDLALVELLDPCLVELRAGRGAPRWWLG